MFQSRLPSVRVDDCERKHVAQEDTCYGDLLNLDSGKDDCPTTSPVSELNPVYFMAGLRFDNHRLTGMSAVSLPADNRFHAFDALRASMMLLGVVLHAAASYIVTPVSAWMYRDISASWLFDLLCGVIHTFRLPLFFVMAGFFAALLAERRGTAGMLRNRWQRLMVPLMVAWPILAPLCVIGITVAWVRHPGFDSGDVTRSMMPANALSERDGFLLHLWFIYDLFIFCLFAAAWRRFRGGFKCWLGARIRRLFGRAMEQPVVFGVITAVTLYPMHTGTFDTSAWLLPPVRILVAYGVFFIFGWLLYGERGRLELFVKGSVRWTLAGLLAVVVQAVGLGKLQQVGIGTNTLFHAVTILAAGLSCWWLIYGFTGIGLRYFNQPRAWLRYLTDASYWIYIGHVPLVLLFAGVLAPMRVPALVKFLIVFSATLGVLLVLYHFAVRDTRIGEQLNGRRYPREWPFMSERRPSVAALIKSEVPLDESRHEFQRSRKDAAG